MGRAYISAPAVPLALGLFAILEPLVRYATEMKQYSGDIACTLIVLYGAHLVQQRPNWLRIGLFGLAGAVILWFSQPAVFVLGGAGIVLGVMALRERDWRRVIALALAGALWLASFIPSYQLSLRTIADYGYFATSWESGFAPAGSGDQAFENLRWYVMTFFGIFKSPTGLEDYAAGVAGIAVLVAGAVLARTRRLHLLLLIAPIGLTLIASFLKLYPFQARVLLFLVPILLLLTAEGVEQLSNHTPWRRVLWLGLVLVLALEPTILTAQQLLVPRRHQELRPVLAHVRERIEAGDTVYVYYGAYNAFRYYTHNDPLPAGEIIHGSESRADWNVYFQELDALRGRERVWVIFANRYSDAGADERELLLFHLNQIGRQLDEQRAANASAHLYMLPAP
ncbi:MAG: hypothetical protein HC822_10200 [Oscillochloris sp.]|nr:hypothetical protein [Oscillochloris sp.]